MYDLIRELDRLGVRRSVDGDQILLDAAPGVLTPELLDTCRTHKPTVIAVSLLDAADEAGVEVEFFDRPARSVEIISLNSEGELERCREHAPAEHGIVVTPSRAVPDALIAALRRHAEPIERFLAGEVTR